MASNKPYLIRAIHEWCSDEGYTPYLAVQVSAQTRVPREFVREGQIVLNVSLDASHQLHLGNDEISFQTRFNGSVFNVLVPVRDVIAIYSRENGQGMSFDIEDAETGGEQLDDGETPAASDASSEKRSRKSSHLTRIK